MPEPFLNSLLFSGEISFHIFFQKRLHTKQHEIVEHLFLFVSLAAFNRNAKSINSPMPKRPFEPITPQEFGRPNKQNYKWYRNFVFGIVGAHSPPQIGFGKQILFANYQNFVLT